MFGSGGLPLPEDAGRLECQVVDPVGLPIQARVTVLDDEGRPVVEGGADTYGLFTCAAHVVLTCGRHLPGDARLL